MPVLFEKQRVPEVDLPDPDKAKKESIEDEKKRENARRVAVRRQSKLGLRQLRSPTETADVKL